ncbi:hypothetical protein BBJ67_01060 [Cutibacterium acnes]|nr:hypothetical protein ALW22_00685 [Cutibacterium acnes]OFP24748.1 hypothetical protein HMPREF2995_04945 [Propionibacterium sp. HMSC062D02]OIO55034.1 MAG: hypothetical protein AUJ79_08215 [Propionibacterium sp. CG1_02_60_36]OEU29644.1 hypothetical protein BBJ67_01060 [Cutibacterium acnes]PKC22318.1 hypothetical protein APS62_01395 [Cutibacterium acnes]
MCHVVILTCQGRHPRGAWGGRLVDYVWQYGWWREPVPSKIAMRRFPNVIATVVGYCVCVAVPTWCLVLLQV